MKDRRFEPSKPLFNKLLDIDTREHLLEELHISDTFKNVAESITKKLYEYQMTDQRGRKRGLILSGWKYNTFTNTCYKTHDGEDGIPIYFEVLDDKEIMQKYEIDMSMLDPKPSAFTLSHDESPDKVVIVFHVEAVYKSSLANSGAYSNMRSIVYHELLHVQEEYLSKGHVRNGKFIEFEQVDENEPLMYEIDKILYRLSPKEQRAYSNQVYRMFETIPDDKIHSIIKKEKEDPPHFGTPSSIISAILTSPSVSEISQLTYLKGLVHNFVMAIKNKGLSYNVRDPFTNPRLVNRYTYFAFKLGYYAMKSEIFEKKYFDDNIFEEPFHNMSYSSFLVSPDKYEYAEASTRAFLRCLSEYEKLLSARIFKNLKERGFDIDK